jgi:hypothetical protein
MPSNADRIPCLWQFGSDVRGSREFRTLETLPVIAAAAARRGAGLDAYPYIASASAAQAARALKVLVT